MYIKAIRKKESEEEFRNRIQMRSFNVNSTRNSETSDEEVRQDFTGWNDIPAKEFRRLIQRRK